MADAQQVTAHSLLLVFLELFQFSPDLADWTEERLSDNPPRLIRLRQLVAMFRAFRLPWDPSSFVKGAFIHPEHPQYAALLSKFAEEIPQGAWERPIKHQLPRFFEMLFIYRTRVENVLSFSSGVLETSGLYLHAHRKAGKLNRVIRDNIAIIDGMLAACINPEGTSFSIEQLIKDYGYPDIDLFEIDVAWW